MHVNGTFIAAVDLARYKRDATPSAAYISDCSHVQLTCYTDYAIRVLLHVGAREEGDRSSVQEIAEIYGISKDHLKKVVQDLAQAGFLEAARGRGGGIRLGRKPEMIGIGEIVRHTESGFDLVDCSSCIVAPACSLPRILNEATQAFLSVLDRYTLADVLSRRVDLRGIFGGPKPFREVIRQETGAAEAPTS